MVPTHAAQGLAARTTHFNFGFVAGGVLIPEVSMSPHTRRDSWTLALDAGFSAVFPSTRF